jgi:hypothetical protein
MHLLNFFYPPSLVFDFPLVWPVFHNIACIYIRFVLHIWEKTCSFAIFSNYNSIP